jgi:hypothetical protein
VKAALILPIVRLLILLITVTTAVYIVISLLKVWVKSNENRQEWFILLNTLFVLGPLVYIMPKNNSAWGYWTYLFYVLLLVFFLTAITYCIWSAPTIINQSKRNLVSAKENVFHNDNPIRPLPKIKVVGQKEIEQELLTYFKNENKNEVQEFVFKYFECSYEKKLRQVQETNGKLHIRP